MKNNLTKKKSKGKESFESHKKQQEKSKRNKPITLLAPITFTKDQLNQLIKKNFQKSTKKKNQKSFNKSISIKKQCQNKEEN